MFSAAAQNIPEGNLLDASPYSSSHDPYFLDPSDSSDASPSSDVSPYLDPSDSDASPYFLDPSDSSDTSPYLSDASPYGRSSPRALHCGPPLALGRQTSVVTDLHKARPQIEKLYNQQKTKPQTPVQLAGPGSFCDLVHRKGHEWERHISETAVHKVKHALGQRSAPDEDISQSMRDRMHRLFWILWTRSALFCLRCECGHGLTAGIPGQSFDAGDIDFCTHVHSAMSRELEHHSEAGSSDLVLLAQDVVPDDVNGALSAAWAFLSGDAEPDLFGAESVSIMQALIGFMSEALTRLVDSTEQHGVNNSPVAREFDRCFANFLALCIARTSHLMAAACVASIEKHEEEHEVSLLGTDVGSGGAAAPPPPVGGSDSDLEW